MNNLPQDLTNHPRSSASGHARPVFGRERELALLGEAMRPAGPRVIHVHGISGIGKSVLTSEFAAICRSKKRTVRSGEWGIGGKPMTAEAVRALAAFKPAA